MQLASLADLLDVQDLDLAIDRLLEQRQTLPELDALKTVHESAIEVQGQRDVAADALRTLELALDKAEGELEILEAKLGEHEMRLYAGGMSARETEHMRLEVQSLKGQQSALEGRVLQMLDEVDPARAEAEMLQGRLDELMARKTSLETSIKAQWSVIDAELARKEERKKDAIAPIDPDLLETYERLRRIKEGVAIASYDHGVCGGCHMTLSPTEKEEAFESVPPRCTHCRRLLVA